MIEYYSSAGVIDGEIKVKVLIFVEQCKAIATAKQNFKIGINFFPKDRKATLARRIEIIFGTLAGKLELADAADTEASNKRLQTELQSYYIKKYLLLEFAIVHQ